MSVNVIERILCRLLPAAGLTNGAPMIDRWKSGRAVTELTVTRNFEMRFGATCKSSDAEGNIVIEEDSDGLTEHEQWRESKAEVQGMKENLTMSDKTGSNLELAALTDIHDDNALGKMETIRDEREASTKAKRMENGYSLPTLKQ